MKKLHRFSVFVTASLHTCGGGVAMEFCKILNIRRKCCGYDEIDLVMGVLLSQIREVYEHNKLPEIMYHTM
jgi:hypothetical protein